MAGEDDVLNMLIILTRLRDAVRKAGDGRRVRGERSRDGGEDEKGSGGDGGGE